MNVIFIMNDSFRRDHLGCYGGDRIRTPHLDRFANDAAIVDQYYLASYPTVPARWDLATGCYGFPSRGWAPLGSDDRTLAQLLGDNSFHTQIIWDTPMLARDDYNYTRGFKGVEFVRGQKGDGWITDPTLSIRQPAQPHKIKSIGSLDSYLRNHAGRRLESEYCAPRVMSTAMEWLQVNHTHDPFFLWIDMWDPHEPFDCPPYDYELYGDSGYRGDRMLYPQYGRPTYMSDDEMRDARALYAGNVTLVDRWVGSFFDLAERLGLFQNTLILWATDHGHLFGDHDLQGKPGAEFGRLYETTARIPLLMRHPDGAGAGQRVRGLVQPVDILPSILEAADISVPGHVQGKSIWPLLSGSGSTIRDCAFSNRYPDGSTAAGSVFDGWVGSDRVVEPSTLTTDKWAFLCSPAGLPSELYDLETDPDQEYNVIDKHPAVAESMRKDWIAFLEQHGATEERIRPFTDGNDAALPPQGSRLYAFRDDLGQWIAFPEQDQASRLAHRDDAPGPVRAVEETTLGALLDDNPKNLVCLHGQYYWAEDLWD